MFQELIVFAFGNDDIEKGCSQIYTCGQQSEKGLSQLICAAALSI